MIRKIAYIVLILLCFTSCDSTRMKNRKLLAVKSERIRDVIKECGYLKLPLKFDANIDNSLQSNYSVGSDNNDSLIFDGDIYGIIGFLPVTEDYYAFLFHTLGDMLYPTIMTIDKMGNKIDRQIICAAGCAGHAALQITSCYDSVWISNDLKIKSISKVIGTVEREDSVPAVLTICNVREVNGFIDKNGKIILTSNDLVDCNE